VAQVHCHSATCPNWAMVTAGLDSLDLFEPMLAIRKLLGKL